MTRIAAALLGTFVAIVTAQHALVPSLDPARNRVSEFANAGYGGLMVAGFVAWAASLALTAAATRGRPIIAGLMLLAAVGALLVAVFPTQTIAGELPPGVARALPGQLHDAGAGLVFLGCAGTLLAAVAAPGSRRQIRLASVILLAVVAALLAAPIAGGFVQRATLLAACVWQFLLLRSAPSVHVPSGTREMPPASFDNSPSR